MSLWYATVRLIICASLLKISHEDPHLETSRSELQQIVDTWINTQAAGAVATIIVTPNETVCFYSSILPINNKTFPDEDTLFEIGSITKGFTGLLLADQVLAGNVFLNDTLDKLLTDWPGRFTSEAGNVTLLELTTHTSGLPRLPDNLETSDLDNPYANYTKKKLYDWLDNVELSNRSSFLYSNVAVGILGHALATVAGKKYEDFLKERVLLPLELNDTTITLNSDQKSRMAPGHDENGTVVGNWDFDIIAPAGALRSSISEFKSFLRFATSLDQQTVIDKALEFAIQPRRTVDQNATIGCNWLLREDKPFVYHSGATHGYSAYIGWDTKQQVGVGVLASIATSNNFPNAGQLGLDLLETWNRNKGNTGTD